MDETIDHPPPSATLDSHHENVTAPVCPHSLPRPAPIRQLIRIRSLKQAVDKSNVP